MALQIFNRHGSCTTLIKSRTEKIFANRTSSEMA